jgi:general secretion pathway protein B
MSFILDALRKSETERQQQAGGEFSSVPSSSGESQSHKWLWMLALLLLVNVAVLIGILLRPPAAPEPEIPVQPAPAQAIPVEPEVVPQEALAEPSFEDRVAQAKQKQPAPDSAAAENAAPAASSRSSAIISPPPSQERVMTLDELRLAGAIQLPELHLDIHVYADEPAERFVFVNMNKLREGSRLDEGPVVSEITPEGVVMQHQGRTFLLPRE